MWQKDLPYQQVAAVFEIRSPGCIAQWERRHHDGGIDALSTSGVVSPEVSK
jgi:transposase